MFTFPLLPLRTLVFLSLLYAFLCHSFEPVFFFVANANQLVCGCERRVGRCER
jgi:hypothetical protein